MNRRSLLQLLSGVSILPLLPGTSLANTNNRRIILLELTGANDGLNTVAPYRDERYHQLRPQIGLKNYSVIALDDYFGFNNAFEPLMPLWEREEMAVVHGLGYPNPNRSHFKSIALWESGGDGNAQRHGGWMTHDIEHAYAIANMDAHGISLGGGMGIFESSAGNWISMASADQFSDVQIKPISTPADYSNKTLNTLLERSAVLNASIERIAGKVENNKYPVAVKGNSSINKQLTHAINLINSGVNAPVLKISLGNFDTHESQIAKQKNLLRQLAKGISRLRSELIKTDNWNNTVVLTYSEFGRRAAQNHNNGTDHGTATCHFVFGGEVNGGFHGNHPDLSDLKNGDLQFTMDYRALYSSMLSDWLQLPTNSFIRYQSDLLNPLFS